MDDRGRTLLIKAVGAGNKEMAQLLLDKGAHPEETDEDGRTALIYAAESGHIGTARLLLDRGATCPSIEGKYGDTALRCAAGHLEVAQLLRERGAREKEVWECVMQ